MNLGLKRFLSDLRAAKLKFVDSETGAKPASSRINKFIDAHDRALIGRMAGLSKVYASLHDERRRDDFEFEDCE